METTPRWTFEELELILEPLRAAAMVSKINTHEAIQFIFVRSGWTEGQEFEEVCRRMEAK